MTSEALTLSSFGMSRTADQTPLRARDDETLFAAAAGGDQDAFGILVDRHLTRTLALATRMLGNPSEADDVAQEAMMRVWTRGNLWRPGTAKFTTWLHRVTVNLCIDRLRRRSFRPLEDAEHIADKADPARDVGNAELKRAVEAALDALPGKQKAAIVLCHYEGYTGKEASELLGVSTLAVQSLLVRARATLRQALAGYAFLEEEA